MMEGLVCLLIKSATGAEQTTLALTGLTDPVLPSKPTQQEPIKTPELPKPPAPVESTPKPQQSAVPEAGKPLTFQQLPQDLRSKFEGLQKANPWMYGVVQGSTFEPGAEGKYKFTPSKDILAQIGKEDAFNQALYDYNETGDIKPLWEYGLKQTPGQGLGLNEAQYLQYQEGQVVPEMQNLLPGMNIKDPNLHKQLESYQGLSDRATQNLKDQIISSKNISLSGLKDMAVLGNYASKGRTAEMTDSDWKLNQALEANKLIQAGNYTPEQKANAQKAVTELQGVTALFKPYEAAHLGAKMEDWGKQLESVGGRAKALQAAAANPQAAQQYTAQALKDEAVNKQFEEYKNKNPLNLPLEGSEAIQNAIPKGRQFALWAKGHPVLAGVIGIGGIALVSYLFSRLFSGGQQQAPQVAYQQPAPLPPQSAGRQYNINNLMG